MTGASEATLQELLLVNQSMAAAITKLAATSSAGGGTSGSNAATVDTTKKISLLGTIAQDLGKKFGQLTTAAQFVVTGLSTLASAGIKTANVIKDLGEAAVDGKAELSSVTGALSGLPGPLGALASAASFGAKVLETNLKTQQDLAKAGANFSGNLDLMRQSAAKSYLSLTEFSDIAKNNGDILRTMGGDVQSGMMQFTKTQNALLDKNSPIAGNLATLGYSFKDAADLTMSYMRAQGNMNKTGLQDQAKITAGIQQYAQELSTLSSLTGESREAIQKKMDEENAEAQWSLFKASLDPAKAEKINSNYMQILQTRGKGAADAYKALEMGLPPLTEAGQLYVATHKDAMGALKEQQKNANDNTISAKENAKRNRDLLAEQIVNGAKDQKQLQTVLRASALEGGELAKVFAADAKLQASFMENGKMKSKEEIKAILDKKASEAELSDSQAKKAQEQQKAMMDLTNHILEKLMPVFNYLLDVTLNLASALGKIVTPVMNFVSDAIASITAGMNFDELGEKFNIVFGKIKDVVGGIGETLSKTFGGGAGIGSFIQNTIGKLFDMVGKLVESGGVIVQRFLQSSLSDTLKTIFDKFINVLEKLVDGITVVVKSPLGSFLIDMVINVFNYLGNVISALIDVVGGAVDIVTGIVQFISGDFSSGFEKIKEGLSGMLGGLWDLFTSYPKYVLGIVENWWELLKSAVTNILGSIIDGIKSLGTSIVNFFSGGGKESTSTLAAPVAPATSAAPSPSTFNAPVSTEGKAKELGAVPVKTPAGEEPYTPQPKKETIAKTPQEMLVAELQTLNKLTAEMLRSVKETADSSKNTANLIASGGNLFRAVA